jgi:hypothetical protein
MNTLIIWTANHLFFLPQRLVRYVWSFASYRKVRTTTTTTSNMNYNNSNNKQDKVQQQETWTTTTTSNNNSNTSRYIDIHRHTQRGGRRRRGNRSDDGGGEEGGRGIDVGIQAVLATMATPTKSRGEHYQQCTTHNNMLSVTHSVRTHYSKHEYSVNVSNSMINTVLFVASCFKRHVRHMRRSIMLRTCRFKQRIDSNAPFATTRSLERTVLKITIIRTPRSQQHNP